MPGMWTVAYLITVGIGVLVFSYYRIHRHTLGSLLGIAVAIEGAFLTITNAVSSGLSLLVGGSVGMMAIFILTFLTFERNSRILSLLGIPVIILIEAYENVALTVPLLLLEYTGLVAAIVSAIDYSSVDISARLQDADGLFRAPLRVFSSLNGLLERIFERPSRIITALVYFTFLSIVLVVAPLLVAEISKDSIPAEPLILVGLIYAYLTREAFARSSHPDRLG